jgi:hypothetical protein
LFGRWLLPWDELRCRWPFLYASNTLYRRGPLGFTQHEKITVDFNSTPNQDIIDPEIRRHAVPVDVVDRGMTFTINRGYQQSLAGTAVQDAPPEDLMDVLPTLKHWESQLLLEVEMFQDEASI